MKRVFRPHDFTVIIDHSTKIQKYHYFSICLFLKKKSQFFGLFYIFCYFIQIQLHGCKFCE